MPSVDEEAVNRALDKNKSRQDEEYTRIKDMHDMGKAAMGGQLVLAPTGASQLPLRVLDSATGDGTWLIDLSNMWPSATLIGADVRPEHFARYSNIPSNISFIKQSVLEEWPSEFASSFDLVHQRQVLSLFSPTAGAAVITRLFNLVKPGGYIQLCEVDASRFDSGVDHAAFERWNNFFEKALRGANVNPTPAETLVEWLQAAGATDINERRFAYGLGVTAKEADASKTTANMASMVDNMASIGSAIPNFFFTPGEFRSLKADMLEELATTGNTFRFRVVWGRRPF